MSSKVFLVLGLALGGCLDGVDMKSADGEAQDVVDEPATDTTEQDVSTSHFDQRSFGGNVFQTPFPPYVTQAQPDPAGNCTPGFVRPVRATVTWTSGSGGQCLFSHWDTSDAHDCRAVISGNTGVFGITCTSTVQEVPEMSGRQGVFSYNTGNTNSANVNTTDFAIALTSGQTVTITTCSALGGSASGDTFLRLFDSWGTQVAANDDNCGLASKVVYTASSSGSFTIHAGCFSNNACSGTVAWSIQ